MSILLLMAMAAGLVAMPAPKGSRDTWLQARDIPEGAFEAGENGALIFKALVAPNGKVEDCRVETASVPEKDWESFCRRVKARFGFRPVTDAQGAPSYYVLEENYVYVLPETWVRNGAGSGPDLVVGVESLPDAQDGRLGLAVNVAVDATGGLRQCNAGDPAHGELASAACGQLRAKWQPMPEKNAAGEPVAYIRQLKVEFRTQKAGD